MAMIRPETEMKDSGVKYIGLIPRTWKIVQLKYCTDCLDGKRIPIDASLRKSGIYPYWGAGKIMDYVDDYIFDERLVLLGEDGAPFFDDFRPVSHLIDGKVWVNNHIHVLRTKDNVVDSYLVHALNSVDYHEYINGSILNKLTQSNMNRIKIPLPSYREQQAIADYLDETCSKIDEIIAEAKASIDEYKELKQSVIFEAVTKGLDKNVEMKQCSVNWLDEIPSTWESIRLKYLLTEINNRSETGTEQPLSVSQVMGVVPSYMIAVANPTASYVGQKIVEPNDIVFNKLKAHLGVFFMSKYHGLVSPDYAVYRTNDKVIPKYLEYLFHTSACISEFKKYISGVAEGLMRLYTSDLFNIRICLPKVDEQIKIVEYVENKVELFDSLIAEKESLIKDLEAYKKSLIYEVVTGKRRVV